MTTRVLLLGGHGKVALHLTPRILSRDWHLTSVVRSASHADDIRAAATSLASTSTLTSSLDSRLTVLDHSLESIRTESDAAALLASAKPDLIIWSAGAGGKGGPERTHAVDNIAAVATIKAAAAPSSGVRAFLMVSYLGSRRTKPAWWSDGEWEKAQEVNAGVLANYFKAKIGADEALVRAERERGGAKGEFRAICLRPGTLTDEGASGRVQLGKTRQGGKVSREDVAEVAVRLLEKEGARGWIDLLGGDEEVREAVERVVSQAVDCIEGEPELD